MKKCITCNKEKPLNEFPKRKDSKDGYRNECKECVKIRKRKEYKKRERIVKICKCCNKEYNSTKQYESKGLCPSCNNKGENNPQYGKRGYEHWNYNSNITDEERTLKRNYPEYNDFRKSVFERDNYTCQVTGVKGGDLVVHHLNSYCEHENLRLDINNGITLSKHIHKLFHDIYGYKNFTFKDFIEFKQRYNNNEI